MSTSEPTSTGAKRHELANCEDCPLNDPGAAFVPSYGNPNADIVFVGEAPGFYEGKEGVPFTGPSGKLLGTVLQHYGLEREQVFTTNTVLCRPADNRNPTKTEIACCAPRLEAEIKNCDPHTVVPLGAIAASAVFGTRVAITTSRVGPPKTSPLYPGVRILPTVHPAFCLRTADAFPWLVNDIGKVFKDDDAGYWRAPTYRVFDEPTEARSALRELLGRLPGDIVIDIEVGVDKDTAFEHPDQYRLLCVGVGYDLGKVAVVGERALQDAGVRSLLAQVLQRGRVVCHNGKFDLAGLYHQVGPANIGFDTMLAHYVLDERRGTHSLGYLGIEELGTPDWKHALKKYLGEGKDYSKVPRDVLYEYNANDVAVTWQLKDQFQRQVRDQGSDKLLQFLHEASDQLMHVEMEGLGVDLDYLSELEAHYMDQLKPLEQKLFKWVDNPRSPQQVKKALAAMGLEVETTNVEQLQHIVERTTNPDMLEFASLLLEHRREQKLYGTYIKGTRKRLYRGRVYPTFLLHGTTTGRLSCRNPNLQNVPRESSIRRLFVPGEGNTFVQGDYAQAELRVVMAISGQRGEVYDALQDPTRNVFDELTLELYGEGWNKEQRVRTKAFVHGTNYGRDSYSIALEYKMSQDEGKRLQQKWLAKIPQVVEWQKRVRTSVLKTQEDLVSPFGRHRRFWLITESNKKDVINEALAFIPQCTASDICLAAGVRLRRDYGLAVRLLVHDSILVECKIEDQEKVAVIVERVMREVALELFSDEITFAVDIAVGPSWGDLHELETA